MVIKRVNNWFNLSKQFLFTYSKGFFNLSYLSNSPDIMIRSFSKMPFMKHDLENKILHGDTPFVEGDFFYSELEEGLWIMKSMMYYKNNVAYKPVYDAFLPADYYFITINFVENKLKGGSYEFNNVKVSNHSLSFSKPGKDFLNAHFKGSKEDMYIIYFSEAWVAKNIMESPTIPRAAKNLFSDAQKNFLNYNLKNADVADLTHKISMAFPKNAPPNIFDLKKHAYQFFSLFFDTLEQGINLNSNQLSHTDRIKIQKIEYTLVNNPYEKFPGIDALSKKFKISPTKLKENFKLLYGSPIYSYFQEFKMRLALEFVENTTLKIKDIAQKFDYENVGKFSQAFKKQHHKLPSEYRK